ncbi:MAG: twin-arginine translocase subunit TatB, partial [Rhodospirillales bacterium]|nr:twin-arginine translocase subunit TatB [Rhodospirillales bacterium]
MFDIGWQELFLIAVVALIVIGPKDLPRVMRTVMRGVRKAREMARDLQGGLDELAREADLDDLKKELESTGDVAKQIEATVDPAG